MKQLLFFLFMGLATVAMAQTKVSGVIKDTSGTPIAFANVIFKDSNEGSISNEEGRFYLESDENYTEVVFSFIGFSSTEVTLTERSTYNMEIVLEEEAAALDEVVIFTGKQSKKNNPAINILRKIWDNRRENGVKKFKQYQYDKYEKF